MKNRIVLVAVASFVVGWAAAHAAKIAFNPAEFYKGKEPKAAYDALLTKGEQLAGKGSWERIGVGRVRYLSGDTARGEEIFKSVLAAAKPERSDMYRIANVYALAGDWKKAQPLFEKALALDPADDRGMIEIGSWYNLNGERERAEALFDRAFAAEPAEEWHYILAAGSYVGVKPF
jgi:tetratricopeptide (TPR) repeat protein